MGFFQNTQHPKGLGGRLIVHMMNMGHSGLARWGFEQLLPVNESGSILDVGCGGGANVSQWLRRCPGGHVTGLDHSDISVAQTVKRNHAAIAQGRCSVMQGDVAAMPFEQNSFDTVSAFETVYFWPGPQESFAEIFRVLKPGGQFLICNESDGTTSGDGRWTQMIDGMTVYTERALTNHLKAVGFTRIHSQHTARHWLCIIAQKK